MGRMIFADRTLAQRLESAEGNACREFAVARKLLDPASGAAWMEEAGAIAVFDDATSPVTQTFGLGMFGDPTPASLDRIEQFFADRGAPVVHEVSPLAGVATLDLLCTRGYRPIEISSVLYQTLEAELVHARPNISTRVIGSEEAGLWSEISARGWANAFPEMLDSIRLFGVVSAARQNSVSFLAEYKGQPGATGALSIHDGVALFAGASTVPELRRKGLQSSLLETRKRFAIEHGYPLAMMVTEAGSQSQRNAERQGFRVAYTRVKWQLSANTST